MEQLTESIEKLHVAHVDNPLYNKDNMEKYIQYKDYDNMYSVVDSLFQKYNLNECEYQEQYRHDINKIKELVLLIKNNKYKISGDTLLCLFKSLYESICILFELKK